MFIFWTVFAIVLFAMILIGAIVHSSKSSDKKNKQQNINEKVLEELKNTSFNVTKIFYINDIFTWDKENNTKQIVVVDNDSKKIAFIDYQSETYSIVDFTEIINYEIYENGGTTTTSIGALGYLSILGADTTGNCKDLKLIIRFNNLNKPHIVYNIISETFMNSGVNKSVNSYKACINTLQEFVSFLEVIKKKNEADD